MRVKVVFLLPGSGHRPVGGFKVVYEYANHLVKRGHQVEIHQVARIDPTEKGKARWLKTLKYTYGRITRAYLPTSWFMLDGRVKVHWHLNFSPRALQDCDVVVATAWQTAMFLRGHPQLQSKGAYLIQHEEFWSGDAETVKSTWRDPLHKVVIARWLQRSLKAEGADSTYIPNGLDFQRFDVQIPLESRSGNRLMMLYHDLEWKGSQDGLQALQKVKTQHPGIQVILFGVPKAPELPDWITYHQTPAQDTLRDLYNQADIFVAPSWSEGWGLPATEAMMCGAAVVATNIGGHQEFAHHEDTALLAEPRNPEDLAAQILRLLGDRELRMKIARQGHEFVQQFTWDRATDRLIKALQDAAKGNP